MIVSPEKVQVKDEVDISETVPAPPSLSPQLSARELDQSPACNSHQSAVNQSFSCIKTQWLPNYPMFVIKVSIDAVCVCVSVCYGLTFQTDLAGGWVEKSSPACNVCVCVCLCVCLCVCVCVLWTCCHISRQTRQVDEWKSHHELAVKFLELGVASHHKRRHSLILSLHTNYVHLRHEHTYAR